MNTRPFNPAEYYDDYGFDPTAVLDQMIRDSGRISPQNRSNKLPLHTPIQSYLTSDLPIDHIRRSRFAEEHPHLSLFADYLSLTVGEEHDFFTVSNEVCGLLQEGRMVAYNHSFGIATGLYEGSPVMIDITVSEGGSSRHHRKINNDVTQLTIAPFGEEKAIKAIMAALEKRYEHHKRAVIKWWYSGRSGNPEATTVYLPKLNTTLHPEFYPDLSKNPDAYIKDYLAADAAILLMTGPPGTGKTTLLRHMIADNNLVVHVMYDEALMRNDSVFQNFLFDSETDLMIVEDADTILGDRSTENNKLMARFLNVSDGLIKLPNKKIVFTTNLNDFSKVDQALLRPGRCFGAIHTRHLNLSEAQAAASVAGLAIPIEKREYTIAELFNKQQGGVAPRKVGFV